jgi:hypothetical protein
MNHKDAECECMVLSGYYPSVGCCENGNESSGLIKGREYFNQLSDC